MSREKTTILDLPVEITIEIFKYMSAKDLTFSVQYVCSEWRTIVRNCDEVWTGIFELKSNYGFKKEKALDYLKRSPKIQNIYLGSCDCTQGVGQRRNPDLMNTICELGNSIKILRIYDPHPDDVQLFIENLPNLKVIQLEIGLFQINNGRIVDLRNLIRKHESHRVEIELVAQRMTKDISKVKNEGMRIKYARYYRSELAKN